MEALYEALKEARKARAAVINQGYSFHLERGYLLDANCADGRTMVQIRKELRKKENQIYVQGQPLLRQSL